MHTIYRYEHNFCDLCTGRIAVTCFSVWCKLCPREVKLAVMLEF